MVWRLPILVLFISTVALAMSFASEISTTRILVGIEPRAAEAEIETMAKSLGLTQIKVFDAMNLRVFTVPTTRASATIAALSQESIVEYAEVDGKIQILPDGPTPPLDPEK